MAIDLTKIQEPLISAAAEARLVLFIGAGISKQAESKQSDILPNWPELLKEIVCIAEAEGLYGDDAAVIERLILERRYLVAAQELKDLIDVHKFETYIRNRFQRNVKPGRIHRSIFNLRTPLIMTTNYDLLLEAAHDQTFGRPATVATSRHLSEVFRALKVPWDYDSPVIFKLHGTILEPESIVLGERDYNELIYHRTHFRSVLRTIFMTKVVLILGFSFSDPHISGVIAEGIATGARRDYIVLPKGRKDRIEMRRLRKTLGLEVIEYEPSDGHPELRELVDYLAAVAPRRLRKDMRTSR
jgi:hypothetical protein